MERIPPATIRDLSTIRRTGAKVVTAISFPPRTKRNPIRSSRRRLPLEPELDHAPRRRLGLLHVREMARFGDLLEFRAGDRGAVAPAVRGRSEAVLRTPQKQRRNPDAVQPRAQLRVVHVGVPGE